MELTEKNIALVAKFRERIGDILDDDKDDYYVLRWLVARDFNMDKAETMIRDNVAWRKKYHIDTILLEYKPCEVLEKYFPGGVLGHTKDGYAVFLMPSGKFDMTGLSLSAKRHDIIMYNIYNVERCYKKMWELTKQFNERRLQCYMISDMDGFTLAMLFSTGMDILLKALQVVEDNYPETLKQCLVINAPKIFPLVFNACKPFMSEETKKKVVILGKDWKHRLKDLIDEDQLPKHWGGTAEGDKYCSHKICMGGKVPESYYLKYANTDDFTKATVKPGKTHSVPITVTAHNTVIKYRFQTDNHDLGFSVLYHQQKNTAESTDADAKHSDGSRGCGNAAAGAQAAASCEGETVVLPYKRYQCHKIPEDGVIDCEQIGGTYVFKFDNTFSWIKAKKLIISNL